MSTHSTTPLVTPSVTIDYDFPPYLPPCGRVLHVIQALAAPGEAIQLSNRDLAAAAQCSAGSIPTILRMLERDGWIERVTSTRGSLVLRIDQHADRSHRRSVSDQHVDRLPERSTSDQLTDRSESADSAAVRDRPLPQAISELIAPTGDQTPDPPHTPRMEFNTCMLQQQQPVAETNMTEQAALLRQIGVWPEAVAATLRARPDLTCAEITAKWHAAQGRRGVDPIALLTHCLSTNQPLYAQEERNARPLTAAAASGLAARQPVRSTTPSGRAVDYDAFLAQCRAANPGM